VTHEAQRSSELELYKSLIDEVNKAVDRSGEVLRTQLRDGLTALERKADSNYQSLSERINANRALAQEESLRVEAKIDDIRTALADGNARFAVIEQRIAVVETTKRDEASSHRHQGHRRTTPAVPFPVVAAPVEKRSKLNPLVAALLGAAAATLGGAFVTWVINGGLTVSPHTAATSAPRTP
jgi:hypothetical protein